MPKMNEALYYEDVEVGDEIESIERTISRQSRERSMSATKARSILTSVNGSWRSCISEE